MKVVIRDMKSGRQLVFPYDTLDEQETALTEIINQLAKEEIEDGIVGITAPRPIGG